MFFTVSDKDENSSVLFLTFVARSSASLMVKPFILDSLRAQDVNNSSSKVANPRSNYNGNNNNINKINYHHHL